MITRQTLTCLFALLAMLALSPLSEAVRQGNQVYLIAVMALIAVNLRSVRVDPAHAIGIAAMFLVSTLLALYWHDFKLLFFPVYFVTAVIAVGAIDAQGRRTLVSWLTWLLLLVCVGAIAGFVYALMGGPALFSLQNLDGRTNYFYLSTFSNVVIGNVIRPAGIFDEPGTLSFFICAVAAARHMLGMSKRSTWVLLVSGLFTLSLAHMLYMLCHLLSERILSKKFLAWFVVFAGVLIALSFNASVAEVLDNVLLKRFVVVDGQLAGDNRSALLLNAYRNLDLDVFLVGLDPNCVTNYTLCRQKYGMLGENVLGPLVQGGIFLSLPYYVVLAWLVGYGVTKRSRLVLFGFALVLVQRPYVMNYAYCLLIYLVFQTWRGSRSDAPRPLAAPALAV